MLHDILDLSESPQVARQLAKPGRDSLNHGRNRHPNVVTISALLVLPPPPRLVEIKLNAQRWQGATPPHFCHIVTL